MDLTSAILTLFLVMDPIGNMPLFMGYLKDVKEGRRAWVVARESVFALLILLVFLFFGPTLMSLLGISRESLYISGGVLLFLISVGMIFPESRPPGRQRRCANRGRAVHCAVGRSAGRRPFDHGHDHDLRFAAGTALALGRGVGRGLGAHGDDSDARAGFSRLLGQRGLRACERLMGMVLTVLAVQMFLDGVRHFLDSKP